MGQQFDNPRYQKKGFLEFSPRELESDVWYVNQLSQ
jgi:hypothetical protein